MIYSGTLTCNNEKRAFLIKAQNPDDALYMLSEWPSLTNKSIKIININTDIQPYFCEVDVHKLLYEGFSGIWRECPM